MKALLALVSISMLSSLAFADQCQWVTPAQAKLAKQVIEAQKASKQGSKKFNEPTEVTLLCDSCSDKTGATFEVESVKITNQVDGYKSVVLVSPIGDEIEIDLAYAFLSIGQTGAKVRLAPLAGCPYITGSEGDVLK